MAVLIIVRKVHRKVGYFEAMTPKSLLTKKYEKHVSNFIVSGLLAIEKCVNILQRLYFW